MFFRGGAAIKPATPRDCGNPEFKQVLISKTYDVDALSGRKDWALFTAVLTRTRKATNARYHRRHD